MTLAPIRGAPPEAPNPDFPTEEPKAQSTLPTAATCLVSDQPQLAPKRQRGTPIDVGGGGAILTLRVIPELPAISRPSMTIHLIAVEPSSSQTLGFLRMSAANARAFLTDLRNGRAPIVAKGDEEGTVQIKFEAAGLGPAFSAYKLNERRPFCRYLIDQGFDMKLMADELLDDLGA